VLSVGLTAKDFHALSVTGLLCGFTAGVSYSIFLYFSGKIQPGLDPVFKSVIMLTASIPFVALVMWGGFFHVLVSSSVSIVEWLKWGVVFGTISVAIPMVCFNAGLVRISSSFGSLLSSFELPIAAITAQLVLHEMLHPLQWLGIVCILCGIVISEQRTS
jgi:drug/metabolite transporter (DMT)-like permease